MTAKSQIASNFNMLISVIGLFLFFIFNPQKAFCENEMDIKVVIYSTLLPIETKIKIIERSFFEVFANDNYDNSGSIDPEIIDNQNDLYYGLYHLALNAHDKPKLLNKIFTILLELTETGALPILRDKNRLSAFDEILYTWIHNLHELEFETNINLKNKLLGQINRVSYEFLDVLFAQKLIPATYMVRRKIHDDGDLQRFEVNLLSYEWFMETKTNHILSYILTREERLTFLEAANADGLSVVMQVAMTGDIVTLNLIKNNFKPEIINYLFNGMTQETNVSPYISTPLHSVVDSVFDFQMSGLDAYNTIKFLVKNGAEPFKKIKGLTFIESIDSYLRFNSRSVRVELAKLRDFVLEDKHIFSSKPILKTCEAFFAE